MPISRLIIHIGLLLLCTAVSVSGLYFADIYNDKTHGGRGGAVGVALSFGFLFVSSMYSYRTIEKFDKTAGEIADILGSSDKIDHKVAENSKRITRLKNDIANDVKRQTISNYFLAAAAIISTVFWGFGDIFAECYMLLD